MDLGAQWVHGEVKNVVYDFASKHDLLDDSLSVLFGTSKNHFITGNGEMMPEEESSKILAIYTHISTEAQEELKNEEGSFGDYFTRK